MLNALPTPSEHARHQPCLRPAAHAGHGSLFSVAPDYTPTPCAPHAGAANRRGSHLHHDVCSDCAEPYRRAQFARHDAGIQPSASDAAPSSAGATSAAPSAAKSPARVGITPEEKAAALKEGESYYTARTTLTSRKISEVAGKTLGIKVNIVRLSSTLVYSRAVQEFEQGVNKGDVIDTSVIAHLIDMKKRGMLQPYTPASINLYRSPDYPSTTTLSASRDSEGLEHGSGP